MQTANRQAGQPAGDAFVNFIEEYDRWRIVVSRDGTVLAAVAHKDGAWFAWDAEGRLGPFVYSDSAINAVRHLHGYPLDDVRRSEPRRW